MGGRIVVELAIYTREGQHRGLKFTEFVFLAMISFSEVT